MTGGVGVSLSLSCPNTRCLREWLQQLPIVLMALVLSPPTVFCY